jgi:sugar phosphate isomerase/epimerase
MNKLSVALQLYTVRDAAEKDPEGVIRQVSEMGYDGVELAGFYGLTPEDMRRQLGLVGLTAISAHVSVRELGADPENTIARYKAVGCEYIAIPSLPPDMRPGAANYQRTLTLINRIGALCKENGMVLLYHNHEFEFARMPEGGFMLDSLYDNVPADVLQTQLDTCWVRVAGQDPVAYIKKYAGRCPLVHLKDYYKEGETANMYELIGEKPAAPAGRGGAFEFRPVGMGVQDFPAILQASLEAGASWVVVEQDESVGRTSLEAARLSRAYLREQGL